MPDPFHDHDDEEAPLRLREPRRERSRGPAPVTLIVSLVLLLLVVGGVFFLYREGARGSEGDGHALGEAPGDVRAPAPPQPQSNDPGAGLTISKDDANAASNTTTLAPPPEQPLPTPSMTTSTPPPPPGTAPAAPKATASGDEQPDPIGTLLAPKAVKPPTTKAPAGVAVVQIGAFSSKTLADQEWSQAASIAPGAMAGKGKLVVPVVKDGSTLFRTSITGFASRDQAVALCDRLKAAGGVCLVR
jgi:cell division protein FtsN